MRVQFKNEFNLPLNLDQTSEIVVYFQREDGTFLSKRDFTIVDSSAGLLDIFLTEFEKQALKTGKSQDFFAKCVVGDEVFTLKFHKGLDVEIKDERKVINEKHPV